MFRTVPLSIIRSFSLYTQQLYVIQVCSQLASRIKIERSSVLILLASCKKLLMMDRGTVRNMQNIFPK